MLRYRRGFQIFALLNSNSPKIMLQEERLALLDKFLTVPSKGFRTNRLHVFALTVFVLTRVHICVVTFTELINKIALHDYLVA